MLPGLQNLLEQSIYACVKDHSAALWVSDEYVLPRSTTRIYDTQFVWCCSTDSNIALTLLVGHQEGHPAWCPTNSVRAMFE